MTMIISNDSINSSGYFDPNDSLHSNSKHGLVGIGKRKKFYCIKFDYFDSFQLEMDNMGSNLAKTSNNYSLLQQALGIYETLNAYILSLTVFGEITGIKITQYVAWGKYPEVIRTGDIL